MKQKTPQIEVDVVLAISIFFLVLISRLISKFAHVFTANAFPPSDKEKEIREEMKQLISEKNNLSAKEDLVKYSKLQRRLIFLEEDIKTAGSKRIELRRKMTKGIKNAVLIFTGIIHAIMMCFYGMSAAVVTYPSRCFYPISGLLSFPILGSHEMISIVAWSFICRKTMSLVM